MARLLMGPYSHMRGLAGNLVGFIYKGKGKLRGRPQPSTKPPKPSQVIQRTKFGFATEFMAGLLPAVQIGYKAYDSAMNPMNAAVRDLFDNAIIGTAPDFTVDYPQLRISKGTLTGSSDISAAPGTAAGTIEFEWSPNRDVVPGSELLRKDDLLTVAFYNAALDRYATYPNCAVRSAGTRILFVPPVHNGRPLHVWLFFSTPNGEKASTTQYLGLVTPTA